MSGEIDPSMLHQHWIHSHEEDTENETVYRPSSYDFPPARGRTGFELCADGTMVDYAVGPVDRPVGKRGRWKLAGNQIALHVEAKDGQRDMLTINSVDAEKLVVQKGDQCNT